MEKIKIRGLARMLSWLFAAWGILTSAKGLYDLFAGQPESNLYAPEPWAFVSRKAWLRYGGFELSYGLACLGLAWGIARYSRFLPECLERAKSSSSADLFA